MIPPPLSSSPLLSLLLSTRPSRFKVIAAGICALILTVGLSRFAYTPLLPVMRAQTWLTAEAGGWLATFNYAGYMTGALVAATVSRLEVKFLLYRGGLLLALASTAGMGLTDNMILWSLLRFLGGLSSTAGLLIGSGLVLNWLMRHDHRPELGLHFSGIGLGIAVSGLAVMLFALWGDWSRQWILLSVPGLLLFLPAWFWLPAPASAGTSPAQKSHAATPPSSRWMALLVAAYFCTGFGYVVSATFLVAIVERQPGLEGQGGLVWELVGLAAAPACFLWDRLARRAGDIPALMAACVLQLVSILLPLSSGSLEAALASAVLFGGTFIGIVSLTLSLVGRCYPANPARAMARLTLGYGVAQVVAPAVSGALARSSGNYLGGLWMAAAMMVLALALLVALYWQHSREQGARAALA